MPPALALADGGRLTLSTGSGMRRGSDLAPTSAGGRDAVLVGRAPLYRMGAEGTALAVRLLEIRRAELDTTLALPELAGLDQLLGASAGNGRG